ncbi:MAG: formate dehydrogenase-N subunit alpha [bacterium]|nr:formate dehydrogenase-N subunit alpha [bacterium]
MKLSRREFLKCSGAGIAATTLAGLGQEHHLAGSGEPLKVHYTREVSTVCAYCSCGCGLIAHVRGGEVVNLEGDPDHPVNEGALCSKGSSLLNLRYMADRNGRLGHNPNRLTRVLYRAPRSSQWEEKTWDWAIARIAQKVRETRDASFERVDAKGVTVNRTRAIAHLGSAAINNEENYLMVKLQRALGLIYLDHHARLCHSSTVAGLANTFGRGAMTNHYIDYRNADVIMAIGANTAEMHPMSMRWIDHARRKRGAKLIAVDPRVTRTAAVADIYAPLRPGTDIAFLGGFIRYALEKELYHADYVRMYTNASYLVNPDYSFQDGMFSGASTVNGKFTYDKATWSYQTDAEGNVLKDETLQHPNCVFQLMKRHYDRYNVGTVCSITGTPQEVYLKAAETFCRTGAAGKAGTILYSMGVTQHTYGAQNCRVIGVLQLLLGNMGLAGGGVNAQRGESNVQGSTDQALLYHILPGYLPMIQAGSHPTLAAYHATTPKSGYWTNRPKFLNSLLKAWWGDSAQPENDFCYDYLPKLDGRDYSHMAIFEAMYRREIRGMFLWGQNPVVAGPNSRKIRQALSRLDWVAAIDIFETESATFWKAPDIDPSAVETEVFLLPAAVSYEKPGTIANSGRWIQWRYQAVPPLGDAKDDLWIADRLYKAIRAEYQKGGVFPDPILQLNWNYDVPGGEGPSVDKVAQEMNGYYTATGALVPNFTQLADNGSTACGNWIYSGYYNNLELPACKKRIAEKAGIGLHPDWAFAWPLNRRILYNRCSSDETGRPWCPDRPVVWWQNETWQRSDVPDFGWLSATGQPVTPEASSRRPFIMLPELQGRFFSAPMADGPFPEHYEPAESPIRNILSSTQVNPAAVIYLSEMSKLAEVASPDFPYVATSYRLTEHWQSGIMTRNSPWLNELMPNLFVEISPTLAERIGVENGEPVLVSSIRGEIKAVACVTPRVKPLLVGGKELEIVGMPWHWGYAGMSRGDVTNDLTPQAGDANTAIPEYKAFLCNIRRVS